MSGFDDHAFDIAQAEVELTEFRNLLDGTRDLQERDQVLKAFDRWRNLCAMFGQFHGQIQTADRIKREFTIEKFRADLAVARSGMTSVCFVEFEPAAPHCIFKQTGRSIPIWSPDFEKGFSQVVDWAWAIDVYKKTPPFETMFGSTRPNCVGVLVIGRDTDLSDAIARDRWEWRSQKVGVDSWPVTLLTYDQLYLYLPMISSIFIYL
jgi:hypothetical protein